MHLDDSLDIKMAKILSQLTFFTHLKSLTIKEPRMMCCDTYGLVG